jgi:hypothetical protein
LTTLESGSGSGSNNLSKLWSISINYEWNENLYSNKNFGWWRSFSKNYTHVTYCLLYFIH